MFRATKCVVQPFSRSPLLDSILGECLTLTYNAIEYGERHGITSRKGMKGFYQTLRNEKSIPSCYKVASIARGFAVIRSRKKSEKRGIQIRHRKPLRPMVCIISGFFITAMGRLFVPVRRDKYFDIQLNRHVIQTLTGKELRSLTITPDSLYFCYSEEVRDHPIRAVYGVDRNEKNITFGNADGIAQLDMKKLVRIRQRTREILSSFRRNDVRIRRKLARKYWKRCNDRTGQILHAATNFMVGMAAKNGATFAIEDLTGIRKMYRRGSGQGNDYRFRMNSWPHWKARKMLEYKSAWKGIEVLPLTKSDTRGSSSECSTCGEKLDKLGKGDVAHSKRMLRCQRCKVWIDRDVNAALNLSTRGLARWFASSRPHKRPVAHDELSASGEEKGLASEAMRGNGTRTLILRVDASKLTLIRRKPKS